MSSGLAEELKAYARSVGFDVVGVTDARPFEPERAFLAARASAIGPNPYEHPDAADRVEPERLLPGARSIIAVGVSYAMPEAEPAPPEALTGWLSRYCRGEDYHTLMEDRMALVVRWLEARHPGARCYAQVDMGPPLDRAVAERAGLGKFGKSTLLITPGLGTWTFLGNIYTTVELAPDAPLAFSPCGSCTRCLDACPTGAITEWALDWRRCLGYLNQIDGDVPEAYRAAMGDRLFGCDDCQTICPYNKAAATGLHPEFAPREGIGAHPSLVGLLEMTEPDFKTLWGPTAAEWRGLEAVQRNALVALGNSGRREAVAPLTDALDAESPLLRRHAAWGLGRLSELDAGLISAAVAALTSRLAVEPDATVREAIASALSACSAGPAGTPR